MKQTTPEITDKMRAQVELYLQFGEGIVAPSTLQSLRGAWSRRNAKRVALYANRVAKKHDAAIKAVAEMEGVLAEVQLQEELTTNCTELADTLTKLRGEISPKLDMKRTRHLRLLSKIMLDQDMEVMKSWIDTAGKILLEIQDYNSPSSVALRLHLKLTAGKGLICDVKQDDFKAYLDSLENLVLLNDRVELAVWINKAHNHLRSLKLRAMEGIPNTVSTRRRREIQRTQEHFLAIAA